MTYAEYLKMKKLLELEDEYQESQLADADISRLKAYEALDKLEEDIIKAAEKVKEDEGESMKDNNVDLELKQPTRLLFCEGVHHHSNYLSVEKMQDGSVSLFITNNINKMEFSIYHPEILKKIASLLYGAAIFYEDLKGEEKA